MATTQASELASASTAKSRAWTEVSVWAACIAVLAALTGWIFHRHLSGEFSFTFDFPMSYYAMARYWIVSLQHGEWPHWIPYQSMGYPSAMNPQMGMFYPPLWIFVLFRIPYTIHAANVFQVLHILFGGIGALLLLARVSENRMAGLCGAVAFLFFGGFYTNAEHPDIIRAFAWMPWLLWSALIDGAVRALRRNHREWRTRLRGRNLLAPVFLACFITGAYPGLIISGLVSLAIFVTVQAARNDRVAWRDCAVQYAMLAVGVAMAACFLLPSMYMSRGTMRAQVASQLARYYISPADLWQFLYPSPVVGTGDYAMKGMQIPAILLVFAAIVGVRQLRKLMPFAVVAAFAALMCLEVCRPGSAWLVSIVPVLGLSRFPAGDYRMFLSLFAITLGTVGLVNSMALVRYWRAGALMSVVVALIAWQAWRYIQAPLVPTAVREFSTFATHAVLACAGVAALVVLANHLRRTAVIPIVVLPAIVVLMVPVIKAAAVYWGDQVVVAALYDRQGLHLDPHEAAPPSRLFANDTPARPARRSTPTLPQLSWRGYIDGTYMMSDLSNVISGSRHTIETNPRLLEFMRQGSTVTAISCARTSVCAAPGSAEVPLPADPTPAGQPLRYGRNVVEYRVHVPERSLMVENETFADGWNARCETHGEPIPVQMVDRSLRGWVVDAGDHDIQLVYRTPMLAAGVAISLVALLFWAFVLYLWRSSQPASALA